jgi:serine/threonine-protein kinase RsbT
MCAALRAARKMPEPDFIHIRSSQDIVSVRQVVRARAVELGFSLVNVTKVVTAASELARNTLVHGGGGSATVEPLIDGLKRGLRMAFEDHGPGIVDIERAMTDGYTTAGGLGLGLSGAKRLTDEFCLKSAPGEGTKATITKWA